MVAYMNIQRFGFHWSVYVNMHFLFDSIFYNNKYMYYLLCIQNSFSLTRNIQEVVAQRISVIN